MAEELHVFARNQDCSVQLSNGYPNMISYVETKSFSFQPIIPLLSNLGLEHEELQVFIAGEDV
jgi:hypothetical protein